MRLGLAGSPVLFAFVLSVFALFLAAPVSAQNYDPAAPCGYDEQGRPRQCDYVDPGALELQCLTSANWQYCLPYHQRACQTGFQVACQMAQLGQNCQGGDPSRCQSYVNILVANTACNYRGDPQACQWLRTQGF